MYLILSWRNIWRNPRRTLVILTAIIIGIWSMIILGALMRGMEEEMVRNGIKSLTGSIQVHDVNYRNDPAVENSMEDLEPLMATLKRHLPDTAKWTSRLRISAVISNARHSYGVTLVGIDPEKEKDVSFIGQSVSEGRYLKSDDKNKIIVGKALLEKFETRIGRKMILMAQDTEKENSSKAFKIVGIFSAEMESVEKQFVFVPINILAKMLKTGGAVSEISILLPEAGIDGKAEEAIVTRIKAELKDPAYQIETWKELLPMLKAYLNMTDGFLYIWYVVVFIAMGFGIVNTTLMAVYERMREFGLMKAFGMKPVQIVKNVLTESFIVLTIGITAGVFFGFISVALLAENGIDLSKLAAGAEMWGMPRVLYPAIWFKDVAIAAFIVLILGLIVSIYPAVKAARFTPVEAMMHN